jgi:SPP1 family predicted phage head-tail adaptor
MRTMIRAGKLRYHVTIETPTRAKTAQGGDTSTWPTFAKRWMSMRPLSGKEQFLTDERDATIDYEFKCRFRQGITPLMRLSLTVFGATRLFDIKSVKHVDERRRMLRILARERL